VLGHQLFISLIHMHVKDRLVPRRISPSTTSPDCFSSPAPLNTQCPFSIPFFASSPSPRPSRPSAFFALLAPPGSSPQTASQQIFIPSNTHSQAGLTRGRVPSAQFPHALHFLNPFRRHSPSSHFSFTETSPRPPPPHIHRRALRALARCFSRRPNTFALTVWLRTGAKAA